jgi:hypothetical protein
MPQDTSVTFGPISLPTVVLVAIIAAIASLFGAALSFGTAIWNTYKARGLEKLRTELAEEQAEKKARRDYQYEARKRLYQQYEPLLFQLVECCESAKERIYSLARTARQGDLGPTGWLSKWDEYYLYSTIYFLLSPLVIFKLMQRSVTFVDLTVDPYINDQYLLAKQLAWSFTDAHDFAKLAPKIEYAPDSTPQQRELHPENYWRQGVPVGILDKAVEACIIHAPNEVSRCMSFGEFEEAYLNEKTYPKFDYISTVFLDFHPKTRPVLWRMLITQVHIHEALLSTREIKLATFDEKSTPMLTVKPLAEDARRKLDWRQFPDPRTNKEVLQQPFEVALMYLYRENSFVWHLLEK